MKILHIGKYYPPFRGGMESFLEDLSRQQAVGGHEVKVLCHQHEKGGSDDFAQVMPGLEIIRARTRCVIAYAPVAPGFYKILDRLLKKFKPDVIHIHMPNLSPFWLFFFKGLPRIVVHWHSDVVSSENDWKLRTLYPFYRIFESRLLDRADQIICTSDSYLNSSTALKPNKKKCRVIPLGLSLEKMKFSEKENYRTVDPDSINDQLIPDEKFMFSVGRFTYYKGYEYLIRSCQAGYGGKLIIAGDGPLRPALIKYARKLDLEDRILMPGKVGNNTLHVLFEKCVAFCLSSIERTEAFGVVLLEAMSYGKPLITTRVEGSGMNEVNIHTKTGLVVEPRDATELARAMNYMLEHRDEAEAMGLRGRQRLLQRFVIPKIAREIEKIY